MEKSSNSLVKTGGWREKHETNYSGKDGKTAKSLMIMIMMTMIITLMITKCVNYVFVIKFDLGCSDRTPFFLQFYQSPPTHIIASE